MVQHILLERFFVLVVLCSGPVNSNPDLDRARKIYTANTGTWHLPRNGSHQRKVTAVIAASLFDPNGWSSVKTLQISCPYSRLVISESMRFPTVSLLGLVRLPTFDFEKTARELGGEFNFLTNEELAKFILGMVGWSWGLTRVTLNLRPRDLFDLTLATFRGTNVLKKVLASLVTKSRATMISTGALAIIVAVNDARKSEKILVYGMSATRDTYANGDPVHFTKGKPKGVVKHLSADVRVLSRVLKRTKANVDFEDPTLSELIKSQK